MIKSNDKKKRASDFVLASVPELGKNEVDFFINEPNGYLDSAIPLELFEVDNEHLIRLAKAFAHPADVF